MRPDHPDSIATAVDKYLAEQRQRVATGQIEASTYQGYEQRIGQFQQHLGKRKVKEITAQLVTSFRDHIYTQVAAGSMSPTYGDHQLKQGKWFITWAWQNELLESLPRNLDTLSMQTDTPEIKTFANKELETLLEQASERTRLFALLMLNCGMYQKDIADLRHDQVDWQKGRIIRKRSKTKRRKSVPTVDYLLWDETFALLKKYKSNDPERVILLATGKPLVERYLGDDGKPYHIDNFSRCWSRLRTKLKNRKLIKLLKPAKLLRKTSATMLETHPEFGRYAQYFLGQAPDSVAESRYAKPSADRFDAAIRWLGHQYGFSIKRKV